MIDTVDLPSHQRVGAVGDVKRCVRGHAENALALGRRGSVHDVDRTTERLRCRGRSGSRPRLRAVSTATRWARTRSDCGSRWLVSTRAPLTETSRTNEASGAPNIQITVSVSAADSGPCRYSNAG